MANTLLSRAARGVVGGLAATLAMSCAMYVAKKGGLLGEPPPRKITRAFLHGLGLRPRRRALNLASVAMHLGFGASMGGIYGVAQPRRFSPVVAASAGLAYGGLVWASSYAGWVPALAIMPRPMWDRPGRPTAMIGAHAVYGVVLAEVVNALQPATRRALGSDSEEASDNRRPGQGVTAHLEVSTKTAAHPTPPPLRSAAADLHSSAAPLEDEPTQDDVARDM